MNSTIAPLEKSHIPAALELIWRVFLEFEAPDYSDEGVAEFRRFLHEAPQNEQLRFWGCFADEEADARVGVGADEGVGAGVGASANEKIDTRVGAGAEEVSTRAGAKIIGVIATRPPCHIALLFVDKQHHRRGVARSLLMAVLQDEGVMNGHAFITVNSSPYALEAYRHLGFISTDTEQATNGIRYYPMQYALG